MSEKQTVEAGNSLPPPPCSALIEWARLNDVTVSRMLRANEPLENIVGVLAQEKQAYVKRIMELESIAPRKVVMPDGNVMLWQCPPELVAPCMPNKCVDFVKAHIEWAKLPIWGSEYKG